MVVLLAQVSLSDTEIIQGVFDKGYHYNLKPDIIGYMVFQWVGTVPAWLKNDTLKWIA
ncbi:MAG: hypothetical protein LC660_10850 [Desulfobacteraceae bacterium]|nr:hypothetical protein [Desulfobacteraceae bacterium]